MTPEGLIKQSVCDYLSLRQDIMFWNQESVGQFDVRTRKFRKKKSKYQRNGVPDVFILMKCYGLLVWVGMEIKSKTGRQTDSQKEFQRDLEKLIGPGYYFIIRSPEEARDALLQVQKRVKSMLSFE